jgi:hypothetical protein
MIDWIKFKEDGEWKLFPMEAINHMSRTHCLWLFADKSPGPFHVPVVAKCQDQYISNCRETRHLYHKSRLKIMKFADPQMDDRALSECGFL